MKSIICSKNDYVWVGAWRVQWHVHSKGEPKVVPPPPPGSSPWPGKRVSCSGFAIEPYPVTEMLAELTGETISVPGTTPALAPSRAAQSASPPGDPGANDVTVQLDAVRVSPIL